VPAPRHVSRIERKPINPSINPLKNNSKTFKTERLPMTMMIFSTLALVLCGLLPGGADAFQLHSRRTSTTASRLSRASRHLPLFETRVDESSSARKQASNITDSSSAAANLKSLLGLENPPISPFGKGCSGQSGPEAKRLLGGKGANLAEMSSIGLSVPPGFTITTECCDRFCSVWKGEIPNELWNVILRALEPVEEAMESRFGDPANPLLLSVRSGAAVSMPGMMDTGK
jgi:pyruvate,orthophosphate dikinase